MTQIKNDPWRVVLLGLIAGLFGCLLWFLHPFQEMPVLITFLVLEIVLVRLLWYADEAGGMGDGGWFEEDRPRDKHRPISVFLMMVSAFFVVQSAWPPIDWGYFTFFATIFAVLGVRVLWWFNEQGPRWA